MIVLCMSFGIEIKFWSQPAFVESVRFSKRFRMVRADRRNRKGKTARPLTDAELKAKAISRWENEGGALPGPAVRDTTDSGAGTAKLRLAPTERSQRPRPTSKQDISPKKRGR